MKLEKLAVLAASIVSCCAVFGMTPEIDFIRNYFATEDAYKKLTTAVDSLKATNFDTAEALNSAKAQANLFDKEYDDYAGIYGYIERVATDSEIKGLTGFNRHAEEENGQLIYKFATPEKKVGYIRMDGRYQSGTFFFALCKIFNNYCRPVAGSKIMSFTKEQIQGFDEQSGMESEDFVERALNTLRFNYKLKVCKDYLGTGTFKEYKIINNGKGVDSPIEVGVGISFGGGSGKFPWVLIGAIAVFVLLFLVLIIILAQNKKIVQFPFSRLILLCVDIAGHRC